MTETVDWQNLHDQIRLAICDAFVTDLEIRAQTMYCGKDFETA